MFDFSFAELFIVAAAAIFLIGPKDIPGVMKTVGQFFRRLQYIRYSMTSQFDKFMDENDLNEIRHYSVDPMADSKPSTILDEKELDEEADMLPLPTPSKEKLEAFAQSLKPYCSKATAYRPGKWRKNNPLFDHCVPVSLVIQDQFGGDLKVVNAIHKDNPDDQVGHVFNVILGEKFDGTEEQFKTNYRFEPQHIDLEKHNCLRDLLLSDPEVEKKYTLFKEKIAESV